MANLAEVHAIIDSETLAEFTPDFPIIFGNQDDSTLLQGTTPFIKQSVHFTDFSQFELGAPENSRVYGNILINCYEKKGTGSASRNIVLQRTVNRFRNKVYSNGLTTLAVTSSAEGTRQNWNVSSILVPFYFHNF